MRKAQQINEERASREAVIEEETAEGETGAVFEEEEAAE